MRFTRIWAVTALGMLLCLAETSAQATGSITGRILQLGNGQPLTEAHVRIGRLSTLPPIALSFHFTPLAGAGAITDANGVFQVDDLPSGEELTVLAFKTLHGRRLLGGMACPPIAPALAGVNCATQTPADTFVLAPAATLDVGSLSLPPAARLSGRLLGADTDVALSDATVLLKPQQWIAGPTDQGGNYLVDHMPLASYHPLAQADGHVDSGVDGESCGWFNNCDLPAALDVVASTQYSQDFNLPEAARIELELYSAGDPIVVSTATLFSELHPGRPEQDGSGAFDGLPAGTYTLLARPANYQPQYYDSLPCPEANCPGVVPTPITLAAGETRLIQQELDPLRSISGRVIDQATGTPLAGVEVRAVRFVNQLFWLMLTQASAVTDGDGGFALAGLPEGAIDLVTNNDQHYIDVRYPTLACRPHDVCHPGVGYSTGHFQLGASSQISGIDIELTPGGRIAGNIQLFSQPLAAESVRLRHVENSFFNLHLGPADGGYVSGPGLIPGPYHALVQTAAGTQVYDGIVCPDINSCALEQATAIMISGAAQVDGIDFDFAPEGERIFHSGFEVNDGRWTADGASR